MFKIAKTAPYKGTYDLNSKHYQLDLAYRILSDHSRMMAICIADGMYPDTKYVIYLYNTT